MNNINDKKIVYEEIEQKASSGMAVLIINTLLIIGAVFLIIFGGIMLENGKNALGTAMLVVGIIYSCVGPLVYAGLKVVKPNEALVLTLFGKYTGTLKREGFYFVNPFSAAVNPAAPKPVPAGTQASNSINTGQVSSSSLYGKHISLKAMTLVNDKQKINDQLGNPIEVGVVIIWRVINTAMAVFNVDNFMEYLSVQCDSSLRNIVRMYPYDVSDDDEKSLRGSSAEVADKLKTELQSKVEIAGLEIIEARITHLAYAPEIAAAMLQRQQATAIVDARKMIVDGAVGMVEMALNKLSENQIVDLDDERKAAMVSNLLVVLCGNRDAQPVVNSGSLY
jgi:regulator of protease activity HflC (stomatin/prohibitin superfamily)